MKKISIVFIVLAVVGFALSGCNHAKKESKQTEATTTIKEKKETNETKTSTDLSKEVAKVVEKKAKETDFKKSQTYSFLKNFGNNWLNYTSIRERNQSVRDYMTDECIKANAIDAEIHTEFDATGKINDVYQSLDNENSYSIFGVEESKGNRLLIVLLVDTVEENNELKISKLTVNYIRQAY